MILHSSNLVVLVEPDLIQTFSRKILIYLTMLMKIIFNSGEALLLVAGMYDLLMYSATIDVYNDISDASFVFESISGYFSGSSDD